VHFYPLRQHTLFIFLIGTLLQHCSRPSPNGGQPHRGDCPSWSTLLGSSRAQSITNAAKVRTRTFTRLSKKKARTRTFTDLLLKQKKAGTPTFTALFVFCFVCFAPTGNKWQNSGIHSLCCQVKRKNSNIHSSRTATSPRQHQQPALEHCTIGATSSSRCTWIPTSAKTSPGKGSTLDEGATTTMYPETRKKQKPKFEIFLPLFFFPRSKKKAKLDECVNRLFFCCDELLHSLVGK
jgi:hypothetical protein